MIALALTIEKCVSKFLGRVLVLKSQFTTVPFFVIFFLEIKITQKINKQSEYNVNIAKTVCRLENDFLFKDYFPRTYVQTEFITVHE